MLIILFFLKGNLGVYLMPCFFSSLELLKQEDKEGGGNEKIKEPQEDESN